MRNGITFRNKHSTDFGVTVKTKSRSLLPEVKSYTYSVPLTDGEYDLTDCNRYGRAFYNSRVFELEPQISADNLTKLERKAAVIAQWLTGKGELIFDDTNAVKWKARCVSGVTFTPEKHGKTAKLSVIFKTDAAGTATFDVLDGITLGDAVTLDSDIPLDMTQYFEKSLSYGENTVKFVNIGDFYIRPVLKFSGEASNITVTYRDTKIMLKDLSGDVIIDLEKCIVTNASGGNLISKMQGKFFELPGGVSELEIYVDKACTLQISYVPKTIYDFDFSSIDWGDDNA